MTAWTPPASTQDAVLLNIPSSPSSFPALCSRVFQLKPAWWNNVCSIWLSRIKHCWISKDENIKPVSCHGLSPCPGGFFVHLVFTLLCLIFQSPLPQTKLNKEAEAVTNTPRWLHLILRFLYTLSWSRVLARSPWRPPHSHASHYEHSAVLAPGPPTCYTPSHPTVFPELSFSYVVLPAANLKPVPMRILFF